MRLALRLLWREWRAGEIRVLLAALVVAVAAVTTVSFFTDRVQRALARQANELIAADAVLVSDHPPSPEVARRALALGLRVATTATFPSMVVAGDRIQLAEIKAVSSGYPLRGRLRLSAGVEGEVAHGPKAGTVWVDGRLLRQLDLQVGGRVGVGARQFVVAAVLEREPDRAADFFSIAPRLMLHEDDLAATGLVTEGSRVMYRLLVAGSPQAVEAWRRAMAALLERGQRLEGVADARPEIRTALERAQRYLGLSALVAAVLAGVAVALATRRFVERHLDGCAVMRCLGAGQRRIFGLYVTQFALLGVMGGVGGGLIGVIAQEALVRLAIAQLQMDLPPPGGWPLLEGIGISLVLVLAFGALPLARLSQVPTLRVIRRELAPPTGLGLAGSLLGAAALAALFVSKAGELRLGFHVAAGLAGVLIAAWLAALALVWSLGPLRRKARGVVFYGLTQIQRRQQTSRLSIMAYSLGLMALFLLTLVRGDLLASWQKRLPPDAPNRFLINVQPDQVEPVRDFLLRAGLAAPEFHPMVRGRLMAINDRPVSARDYEDERSRRLVEREFNLSWARAPRADNRLVAGRFWGRETAPPQWSVEEGIAQRLGIRLGDRLRFDVAGQLIEAPVTSLRHVDWDSMRVNFFVIGTPQMLRDQPTSYITSFHLPVGGEAVLDALVRAYPNITVIDVAAILREVRAIMERVAQTVEFVFVFTLLAGLVVLYAAVLATRDERVYEAAVMRALGARRRQLLLAQAMEFAVIGALAGLLGAGGAAAVGSLLATRFFDLSLQLSPALWLAGIVAGSLGMIITGSLATRRVLDTPPLAALRG
jgi:putative ABC transport system permease protein